MTIGGVPERLHLREALPLPESAAHLWPHPLPQISEAADWLKVERTQVRRSPDPHTTFAVVQLALNGTFVSVR